MNPLQATIRKAQRRAVLNDATRRGGTGAMYGLAAGLALLVIDRLSPLSVMPAAYLLLPVFGILVGVISAVLRHPNAFAIALQIDRALHLQDRIATAHALTASPAPVSSTKPSGGMITKRVMYDDDFAALVHRDAARLAGKLDVRSIVPLQFARSWTVAIGLAAVLWLGYVFLPGLAWAEADEVLSPEERESIAAETQREREELRESLEDTVSRLRRDLAGEDEADRELPIDPRVREQLEALERLAHQLSGENADSIDVERTRDESAARLNELAEQIARQSRKEREAADRLTERFAGIDPPDTPMSAREFQDALRRGEFGRAADLLEDRLSRQEGLSEREREELAEYMRDLDEQIEETARDDQQRITEREAQLEQVLRDHELDEDLIRELLQGERISPEELERRLRHHDFDEELANRLARELERLRDERDVQEQMERDSEAIRESLRDAAEELEQPEAPPSDDQPTDQPPTVESPDESVAEEEPTDPDETDERPETDRDASGDDPTAAPEAQTQPDPEGRATEQGAEPDAAGEPQQEADRPENESPGESPRGAEDDAPAAQPAGNGEAAAEASERESAEGGADQQSPVEESPAEDLSQQDAHRDEVGQPRDESVRDDEPGALDELPQPGAQAAADDDAAEQTVDEETPAGTEQQSPADRLRDIAERRRRSAEQERFSEEMIERAREMVEGMSDDDRRQLAEEIQRRMDEATSPPDAASATNGGSDAGIDGEHAATGRPRERGEQETEDIDLRPDAEDYDRVLAEWLSDEDLSPDPDRTAATSMPSDDRVREARQVAERAVEDAAVPSRYHQFIRRYFGRLEDAANQTERESSP